MTDNSNGKRASVSDTTPAPKKQRLESSEASGDAPQQATEKASLDKDSGDASETKAAKTEPAKAKENADGPSIPSEPSSNPLSPGNDSVEPKEKQSVETSKPVFGATSTFGNASIFEKMKNKHNVFDAQAEQNAKPVESSTSATSSFGGSFGANSKFSNALSKASQKKSFLDEPNGDAAAKEQSPSVASQQYKQVELTEKKVETGEENEKSVFSAKAKIFELDLSNISEGWKERGTGPLHLNQSLIRSSEARLVMRSQGLLRVVLNYRISPTTVLIKGLESSLSPGKFLRLNSVTADGKPLQYMLKFANEEIRDGLFDHITQVKEKIALAEKDGSPSSSAPNSKETGFRLIPDTIDERQASNGLQRTSTDVDAESENAK